MKITVIGTGYVGLVTGACLAETGNDVFCLDLDADKIDMLNDGRIPIYEPGLDELIARNRQAGRIRFSTNAAESVAHGEVQFICVGTPSGANGEADLSYVLSAARNIGEHMTSFKVIVDKSTVPVGTALKVRQVIKAEILPQSSSLSFSVVSNPEFLKEGAALNDFMRPDRIILGCDSDDSGRRAESIMKRLYSPFNRNRDRIMSMDVRSAEFTKYAANAMLATRISFMNELANLADKVGADIESVRLGMGSDPRIGYHFLYAGCGYGGSCFPKDIRSLIRTGIDFEQNLKILSAVESVNENQKDVLFHKIIGRFGQDLRGKIFGIWGLAFKPNTDDMREAPSRPLVRALLDAGAKVQVYDPVAMYEAKKAFETDLAGRGDNLERLSFCNGQYEAVEGADALVVVTEWKAFKSPDISRLKRELRSPNVFDGRNLYDPGTLSENGLYYESIGRRVLH